MERSVFHSVAVVATLACMTGCDQYYRATNGEFVKDYSENIRSFDKIRTEVTHHVVEHYRMIEETSRQRDLLSSQGLSGSELDSALERAKDESLVKGDASLNIKLQVHNMARGLSKPIWTKQITEITRFYNENRELINKCNLDPGAKKKLEIEKVKDELEHLEYPATLYI